MKKTAILHILRWLCLLLCACFLLSACSQSSGSNTPRDQGTFVTTKEAGEDIQKIAQSHHSCITGSILRVMYKDIGAMTTDVYKTLTAENLLSLVILAFTIWMAFQILQHVSSTTPESIGEFWTKVLRKAAICTACGILASSPENILYVINTFIFPIYVTILEFTAELMKHLGSMPEAKTTAIKLFGSETCVEFVHRIGEESCSFDGMDKVEMTTAGFPTQPLELMSCMACSVSDRLSMGFDIGLRTMISVYPTAWVAGFFILGIFFITKISFALYLIDSIFRLNMMIIIMPFLIMFYPFEQTRKWSVKGFQIILSSAAIMMCISLIVVMTVFAMEKLLIDKSSRIPYGDPEQYMNFGIIAMSLLFMALIVKQACSMGVELAGRVTGYSGDTNFAKNIKSIIQWFGQIGMAVLTFGASYAWYRAYKHIELVRKAQQAYEKARNKAESVMARVNHAAGRDRE